MCDVAARAGVGTGTVSRYLNGSASLGETTRAAVAAAVVELGYRPNPSGRALRRGSTGTIGVLVPTMSNPIFGASLDGIEERLAESGRSAIVATSGYDAARQRAAIATLADRGVDGLIATLCDPVAEQREPIESRALPYALIYNELAHDAAGAPCPGPLTVTVDNFGAVRDAVGRLIAAGHARIAFLGGCFAASDRSRARHAGYRRAMEEAGLPAWRPVELAFDADARAFERAVAELLGRLHRPSALVCSNDLLALQAIGAAGQLGLDVPADLSVIGFDGVPMAICATPSLATIHQPAREMGRVAAALLLDRIDGGGSRRAPIVLPHEFVPGGTFAAASSDARRASAGPGTPARRSRPLPPPSIEPPMTPRSRAGRRTLIVSALLPLAGLFPPLPGTASAADAICYNCPPEWADWAAMNAAIEERLGIEMPLDNKNSGQTLAQLIAERASPIADIAYYGVTTGIKAAEEGVVQAYKPTDFDTIPDGLKDPEGRWFTTHQGTLGFFVNVEALGDAPVPACFEDLVKPEYDGLVGYLDPSSAFVGYAGAVAVNRALGGDLTNFDPAIDYFRKLAENDPIVPKQTAYARVVSGEIPILFDYDFNAYRAKYDEDGEFEFVLPCEGTIVVPYVQSLVANAPHEENGKRILDFILSDEGQAIWTNAYLRPARDVALPEDVASKFLPASEYERASSVDYAEMEAAQAGFGERYLNEVR